MSRYKRYSFCTNSSSRTWKFAAVLKTTNPMINLLEQVTLLTPRLGLLIMVSLSPGEVVALTRQAVTDPNCSLEFLIWTL